MFLFWAALAPAGISAQDLPEPMSPRRLVNDFAGLLSDSQRQALERKLVDFDRETSTQIAVVTVDDLGDYAPSDFAQRLHDKWGVGREGKNNGILVLVKPSVPGSRGEAYISVGYGLEGVIPDITAGRILDNEMIPRFREGDIYGGIDRTADVLMQLSRGEFTAEQYDERTGDGADAAVLFVLIPLILFMILAGRRRRSRGRIERQPGRRLDSSDHSRRRIAPRRRRLRAGRFRRVRRRPFRWRRSRSFVVAAFPLFLGKIFVYLP